MIEFYINIPKNILNYNSKIELIYFPGKNFLKNIPIKFVKKFCQKIIPRSHDAIVITIIMNYNRTI